MTPAALTARLKGLESAVGLPLFDRTSAGLRLNTAGRVALEAAGGIERAVREFVEAMHAVKTGQGGRLSVGAVSTAKYFAPRLIAAFLARHPKLELRFLIGNRAQTIDSLKATDVEIALTGRPPAEMPTAKVALGPHPYVMIAPPGHRARRRRPHRPSAIGGRSVSLSRTGFGHPVAVRIFHRRHRNPARATRHGARLQRNDQAGRDGRARHRPDFRPHDRRRTR